MTKKQLLAILKKHNIEVPVEAENDIRDALKGLKFFTDESYQKHVDGLKED